MDLAQRLGCIHRIFQAPLAAGGDTPHWVAAVCEAGARWIIPFSACEEVIFTGGVRMALVITESHHFELEIPALDKAGNPGRLASVPVWWASDPTILTVVPAADGMSAVVAAAGKLGTAEVDVTAEGYPTPGVKKITCMVAVEVVGGKVVSC